MMKLISLNLQNSQEDSENLSLTSLPTAKPLKRVFFLSQEYLLSPARNMAAVLEELNGAIRQEKSKCRDQEEEIKLL